jgi:hypothetical protein
MLISTAATIQAASKNNLALIAFLINVLIAGVSTLVKKEKRGARIAIAFGLICLVGLLTVRLLPKNTSFSSSINTHDVVIHGDGNGTALGNGNQVDVNSQKQSKSTQDGGH